MRDLLTAIVWALSLWIYWWVAETNMAIGRYELGGRVGALATAVPLVIAALANCCLSCCCKKPLGIFMGRKSFRKARTRFIVGFSIALVGATAWILTENMCDRPDYVGKFFRWLPGHFMWHVFMSFGMVQSLLFAGALRADNFNSTVTIDTDGQGVLTCGLLPSLTSWYFFLMPRLILTPMSDGAYGAARVAPEPVAPPADAYVVRSPGKRTVEEENELMRVTDVGDDV